MVIPDSPMPNLDADHAALIPQGAHAGAPPITLKRPLTAIGSRKEAVRIHLESSTVSKIHCVVVLNDWGCYVHDVGSRTHTWVNDEKITDANLADGDILRVGRFEFKYVAPTNVPPGNIGTVTAKKGLESIELSTLSDPLALDKRVVVIGRRPGSDLQLDDRQISNIHAVLFECNGMRFVRDMGSRTGTWLDGKPLHQEPLYEGAEVKIGPAILTYRKSVAAVDEAIENAPLTLHDAPATPNLGLEAALPLELENDLDAAPPAIEAESDAIDLSDLDIDLDEAPLGEEPLDLEAIDLPPSATDLHIVEEPIADNATDAPIAAADADIDPLADLRRGWQTRTSEELAESKSVEADDVETSDVELSHAESKEVELDDVELNEVELVNVEPPKSPATKSEAIEPLELADLTSDTSAARAKDESFIETAEAPAAPDIELDDIDLEAIDLTEISSAELSPPLSAEAKAEPTTEVSEAVTRDVEELAEFSAEVITPASPDLAADAREAPLEEATDDDFVLDLSPVAEAPATPVEIPLDRPVVDAIVDEAVPPSPTPESAESADSSIDSLDALVEQALHDEAADAPADAPKDNYQDEFDALVDEAIAEADATAHETASPVLESPSDIHALTTIDAKPLETTSSDDAAAEEAEDAEDVVELSAYEIAETDSPNATTSVLGTSELATPGLDAPDLDALDLLAPDATAPTADAGADTAIEVDADVAGILPDVPEPTPRIQSPLVLEPEPVSETDAINLSDDLDQPVELQEDATALAVDFGLDEIDLNDDEQDTPTADFAAPQRLGGSEQNLVPTADAGRPVELSDLATTAKLDETTDAVAEHPELADLHERPLLHLADSIGGEASIVGSVIDSELDLDSDSNVDSNIDLGDSKKIGEALEGAIADVGAAKRPDPEDDIPAPSGGSLDDLLGHGAPLLGGTFSGTSEGMAIGGSPSLQFTDNETTQPPKPTRRGPLRVGFGRGNKSASPFANNAPIGDVLIGRRGGPSVDVFANPSPTPEDLAFAENIPDSDEVGPPAARDELADVTLSDEQREILKTAEAFRPRVPANAATGFDTLVGIAPSVDIAVQQAAARKKRIGRVIGCLLGIAVLGGGAMFGVYKGVPVYSRLEATIEFDRLNQLGADDARQFRASQDSAIASEAVRQNAIGSLPREVTTLGFLGDPKTFATAFEADPATRWPGGASSQMHLRFRSPLDDKEQNLVRVRAVAQALVDAAQPDIDKAETLRKDIRRDTDTIQSIKTEIDTLNTQIQLIQAAGNQRPDPATIASLVLDRTHAEEQLRAIRSQRQELEATEQRLSRAPTTAEVTPTEPAPVVADAALSTLNAQLADLKKQGEMMKTGANERSAEARKALDDAIAQLQQDLQTGQKLQDNPELVAYIEAANRTFTQIRKLTEDLIQRQVNEGAQLNSLKTAYAEKLANQRTEALSKDEKLKDLNDRLAIGTRQYNAAVASGFAKDARETDLQNQLLKQMIAGRTELFSNDAISDAMLAEIQKLIDQKEKSIANDRKNVDETLTKAQDDFLKRGPAVEKLPASQKALAAAIEQKLKGMIEARKAYDTASEKTQTEQAKIDADLKTQAAGIQLEITARKNELAAAQQQQEAKDLAVRRQKELADTQTALADIRSKEQQAQQKLDGAIETVAVAEKRRRDFSESDADREEKLNKRQAQDRTMQTLQASLAGRRSELARLIVPYGKPELQSFDEPDRRMLFAGLAAGSIFLLLMIPIGWNLLLLYRETHPHAVAPHNASGSGSSTNGFEPVMPNGFDRSVDAHASETTSKDTDHASPMMAKAGASA